MKKYYLTTAIVLALSSSMLFTSCIGSFALTNNVLGWNKQIGSKFVNELVFFAFWILPVYEVTSIADLLVINSIEFWSGRNPLQASTKVIDTQSGRYTIACDGKGYTVTCQATGSSVRLDFDEAEQTWSIEQDSMRLDFDVDSQTWALTNDGISYPFMTMVDDNHVKMIAPDGEFVTVETSEQGVMAYQQIASPYYMAAL